MLEFNLDGKLNNTFDAGDAYQRVAGSDTTSYGLDQSNDPLTPGAINPLSEDELLSPWDEAGQASNAEGIKRNGALPQGHNAQATQRGVNPGKDSGNHNTTDALTGTVLEADRQLPAAEVTLDAAIDTQKQFEQSAGNPKGKTSDPITGTSHQSQAGFAYIPIGETLSADWVSDELISYLGERQEVNDLLAEERFNRDQTGGKETFYNFTTGSGYSANEGSGYDITDSRSNAAELGTVAYRDDKNVLGTVGYTSNGYRDRNDYFSFYAGKSGTYDLSLSLLSANVGLALYNESGSLMSYSNKSGTQDESISTFLNEGWYTSLVYSHNSAASNNNGATAFDLNISRQADIFEQDIETWIDDSSVKNAALNSIKYDNDFGRNDMVGILKSAGDYDSVSSTELTDLRQIHNMFSGTMRADIAGLSKKVIFGDDSNAWYTGYDSIRNSLGNLEAGTSTQNLNLLIGKHMLGTDRPMIHSNSSGNVAGSYTQAGGSLFMDGVSFTDIDQGQTGDCYLLAPLASTAHEKPSIIRDMFEDNGDGTYSVRFYTNGQADYVTVDNMMATDSNGRYMYADDGAAGKQQVADNNELWVALAEKAYAQLNESGRLGQEESTNRYGRQWNEGISWGWADATTTHITGLNTTQERLVESTWWNPFSWDAGLTKNELINLVNGDNIVTIDGFNGNASTDDDGDGSIDWKSTSSTNIGSAVQGHVYAIVGYNAATQRFNIQNPWGNFDLSLTYNQLRNLGGTVNYSNT